MSLASLSTKPVVDATDVDVIADDPTRYLVARVGINYEVFITAREITSTWLQIRDHVPDGWTLSDEDIVITGPRMLGVEGLELFMIYRPSSAAP